MIYRVTARLKPDAAADFQRKLLDGTIAEQRPDGREIVASMQRALVSTSGEVTWRERCFCDTPLAHERQTVLDFHFEGLATEEVDSLQEGISPDGVGTPFMEYLAEIADRESK